jgi:hypothetical protein
MIYDQCRALIGIKGRARRNSSPRGVHPPLLKEPDAVAEGAPGADPRKCIFVYSYQGGEAYSRKCFSCGGRLV